MNATRSSTDLAATVQEFIGGATTFQLCDSECLQRGNCTGACNDQEPRTAALAALAGLVAALRERDTALARIASVLSGVKGYEVTTAHIDALNIARAAVTESKHGE